MKNADDRLGIIMVTVILYLMSPIAFGFWLFACSDAGCFPVQSDSIGIPLAGYLFAWIVGLPFVILFCFGIEFLCRRADAGSEVRKS